MRESPSPAAGTWGSVLVGSFCLLLAACADADPPLSPGSPLDQPRSDGSTTRESRITCNETLTLLLGSEDRRYRLNVAACNGVATCVAAEVQLHDAILREIGNDYVRCRRGR